VLPLQPETRSGFKSVIFAKDQPQYLQLPANTNGHQVETKWKLSLRERVKCVLTGNLYLTLMTFGQPLQPIRLSVLRDPDDSDPYIEQCGANEFSEVKA
jgi:hypothetical protein